MVLAILSVLKSTYMLHVASVTKQPNRKSEGRAVMPDWMIVTVQQAGKKLLCRMFAKEGSENLHVEKYTALATHL